MIEKAMGGQSASVAAPAVRQTFQPRREATPTRPPSTAHPSTETTMAAPATRNATALAAIAAVETAKSMPTRDRGKRNDRDDS